MAHAQHLAEKIAEETGIPASTLKNSARRLAEHGILPLGSRGREAPECSPFDFANLILCSLSLGDGVETVMSRVPGRVRAFENLGFSNEIWVAKDDSLTELDAALPISVAGQFAETLAHVALAATTGDTSQNYADTICRIGITYSGTAVAGWIEFRRDGNEFVGTTRGEFKNSQHEVDRETGRARLITRTGEPIGLAREIAFDWATFARLADYAAADNPAWAVP